MLADIASGNTGIADLFFLIGFILAALAVLLGFVREDSLPRWPLINILVAGAVGCISFGLLQLVGKGLNYGSSPSSS